MALTPKQARFVAEYLSNKGNSTEAAKSAGYTHPNKQGPRLLVNVGIAAEIAKAQSARTQRTNIDIDYVIQRLAIESERETEGSSHSARVSALGQLRQHFLGIGVDETDTPSVTINLTTSAPVGDVRVTRHKT
jgi:phage terminase small subunit